MTHNRSLKCVLSVAALALALSGCANAPPAADARAVLLQAKPCCASFSAVIYHQLPLGERFEFTISTSSPALETSEGFAYFKAFQLAPGTKELEVQVMSGFFLPSATYPDPLVAIFDDQHRLLTEIRDVQLLPGKHRGLIGLPDPHNAANIVLPANAAYVIIFARPNSARALLVLSDTKTPWVLPSSPVGEMAVVAK